jgi:hypothetical protein
MHDAWYQAIASALHNAACDTDIIASELWSYAFTLVLSCCAGTATKPKAGRQLQELLASASRVHKKCYPMCSKCSTILGTMLCELEQKEGTLNSSQSG